MELIWPSLGVPRSGPVNTGLWTGLDFINLVISSVILWSHCNHRDGGVRGGRSPTKWKLGKENNLYLHRNNSALVFHVIDDENEALTGRLTKASEKARTGSRVF